MSVEPFPYPANVPDCQQIDAESFGVACEPCPFAPECGYLALSTVVLDERQAREDQLEQEYAERLNWIIESNRDPILPGFYNNNAIAAMLEKDQELSAEFLEGRAAIALIDIRGLHATNQMHGYAIGDLLLIESSKRLLEKAAGTRLGLAPAKPESRRSNDGEGMPATVLDVGIRDGNADELFVLLRGINPTDLPKITKRIGKSFSVFQSIRDSRKGHWAIPATISSAHSAEISLNEGDTAGQIYRATYLAARARHDNLKSEQYATMWQLVCEKTDAADRHIPKDERMIYEAFIKLYCEDFSRILKLSRGNDLKPLGSLQSNSSSGPSTE